MDEFFENKTILLTGGTGSLGQILIERLIDPDVCNCKNIIVFSRDETKQYHLRQKLNETDWDKKVMFYIGDIRDKISLKHVLKRSNIVMNLAALKHIPPYEYMPIEAIKTNLIGVNNLVEGILELDCVEHFIQISTDKACKPVNVYGMTKALAERIVIGASQFESTTSFLCVRYGNVLQSRGSMIPFFKKRMEKKLPLLLTDLKMTRFLMTLEESCDLIFRTLSRNFGGTLTIPNLDSVRVVDVIKFLKEYYEAPEHEVQIIGIRPGEKIHEVLISEEEIPKSRIYQDDYVILPSFQKDPFGINPLNGRNYDFPQLEHANLDGEYSSKKRILPYPKVKKLFEKLRIVE